MLSEHPLPGCPTGSTPPAEPAHSRHRDSRMSGQRTLERPNASPKEFQRFPMDSLGIPRIADLFPKESYAFARARFK